MQITKDEKQYKGNFKISDFDDRLPKFEKESLMPVIPHFCPICGEVIKAGKAAQNPLIYFGMCAKCIAWWETEILTNPDASLQTNLNRFIEYLLKKYRRLLKLDYEKMTYQIELVYE